MPTVNLNVSWIENYALYFRDPDIQAASVDVGLHFWRKEGHRSLGKRYVWLEVLTESAAKSELELETEIRARAKNSEEAKVWEASMAHWRALLASKGRRFDQWYSLYPDEPRRTHLLAYWRAYTPVSRLDVPELLKTVEEFMRCVVGWDEVNIHHIRPPSLSQVCEAECWYRGLMEEGR